MSNFTIFEHLPNNAQCFFFSAVASDEKSKLQNTRRTEISAGRYKKKFFYEYRSHPVIMLVFNI